MCIEAVTNNEGPRIEAECFNRLFSEPENKAELVGG